MAIELIEPIGRIPYFQALGRYTLPPEEPITWREENRGKLVAMDSAMMAVHLLAARVAFRVLPIQAERLMKRVETGVLSKLSKYLISFKFANRATVLKLASDTANAIVSGIIAKETEEAIREESLEIQRNLRRVFLGGRKEKRKRRRRRRYVRSRHPTPKQRRPNKVHRGDSHS